MKARGKMNDYKIKCTEKVECPYCKSKNIKQVEEEDNYPFLECIDCGKIYWSD